jgi:hypothetical protein
MVECEQLLAHTGLVAKEVPLHAIHKCDKGPESNGVVLHNGIDRRQQIAHTLDVAKIFVVFVVGEQHIFHLLQMDVGPDVSERRVGVRVRNIFAHEDGNRAICAVYVLLYCTDPIEWGKVSLASYECC